METKDRIDFPALLRELGQIAKSSHEVNKAKAIGYRKTTGAFGGQTRASRAHKAIMKMISEGIAKEIKHDQPTA